MHYISNSIETKILIIKYYKYLLIKKKTFKNQAKMKKKIKKTTFDDENQDAVSREM